MRNLKATSKKVSSVPYSFLLVLGAVNCAFSGAGPADEVLKLNSNDGTTKMAVQNNAGAAVFSADSDGNIVVGGTATIAGSKFSVGGSTFVVQDGNAGIRTASPGAKLEVAGQVKITGGVPGAGKVLTSDAAGLAAWQVAASTYSIGDSYGGGKIFWLDAGGQHGLIAATADQSTGIQWGLAGFTGANLEGVYAGKANTVMISTMQGAGSYAAQLCADYAVTVNNEYYDDWYLPSKYELGLLYAQKAAIGGFTNSLYWSSNEYVPSTASAWYVNFSNGFTDGNGKSAPSYVHCVRAGP